MKKIKDQEGFLSELYARRYLILAALLCGIVAVAIKGVRPAPDAKVRFEQSVPFDFSPYSLDCAARCQVLEVYDQDDFKKIVVYRSLSDSLKDFYVSQGPALVEGEIYYIYRPAPGKLSNRAIFRDTAWDWGHIAWVFCITAIISYIVLVLLLTVLASVVCVNEEKILE